MIAPTIAVVVIPHLPGAVVAVEIVHAVKRITLELMCQVLGEGRTCPRVSERVEITSKNDSITLVCIVADGLENVECCGLWPAESTTWSILIPNRQWAMMIREEYNRSSCVMADANPYERSPAVPL